MADPATLHEGEHRLAERILATAPALAKAREIAKPFMTILRDKNVDALDAWSADAIASHMASFANGIRQDIDAVRHAMLLPWSNGQVEGQIHRLKLLRQARPASRPHLASRLNCTETAGEPNLDPSIA
jgi:transposase